MSDFLTRLAQRQLGQIATNEPRVAPLYGAAKEARNPSFAEDTEYHPVTNAHEAVAMPERTTLQTRGRLPAHADDPVASTEQYFVQTHAGSLKPTPRIDAQSFTPESRTDKAGPFTVEASPSSPTNLSAVGPPANFPRRQQTALARAESMPQERIPVAPMARTAPVAPMPLVKPTHSRLPEPLNEFTAPVVFGSEEDRRREQAQRDKETPVHVTIGRIEVTAMTATAPVKRAPARKQTMSLDDYLARQQRRDR
jgi:hypothetical protein